MFFILIEPLTCTHEVDVVFVIDSSLGTANFQTLIQYLIQIVSEVSISQTETRIALILFSTRAKLAIKLSDHDDLQSLIANLVTLEEVEGSTRETGSAIDLAYSEIRESGRVGVGKIIYVVTGGPSSDVVDSTAARIEGVTLVAVGTERNRAELQSIASSPNFVFALNNLDVISLRSVRESSVNIICTQGMLCIVRT